MVNNFPSAAPAASGLFVAFIDRSTSIPINQSREMKERLGNLIGKISGTIYQGAK